MVVSCSVSKPAYIQWHSSSSACLRTRRERKSERDKHAVSLLFPSSSFFFLFALFNKNHAGRVVLRQFLVCVFCLPRVPLDDKSRHALGVGASQRGNMSTRVVRARVFLYWPISDKCYNGKGREKRKWLGQRTVYIHRIKIYCTYAYNQLVHGRLGSSTKSGVAWTRVQLYFFLFFLSSLLSLHHALRAGQGSTLPSYTA